MINNFNEYQQLAARTIRLDRSFNKNLDNFTQGVGGESGETIDLIKKFIHHEIPLDKAKLEKELGDVMWYVAAVATICSSKLADIAGKDSVSDFSDSLIMVSDLPSWGDVGGRLGFYANYLGVESGKFMEVAGDVVYRGYNKKFHWADVSLFRIIETVTAIAKTTGIDMRSVLNTNIEKLKARYPDGFVVGGGIRKENA